MAGQTIKEENSFSLLEELLFSSFYLLQYSIVKIAFGLFKRAPSSF
ncbi:hypothetical protein BAOM_4797 [Peribacillus asahii]|uniref:Uncharacterized protein n=1 Tax=Peribacillus asahii TaxID=228899 RepID=A0A3T0KYK2_9BACI|nr:hypothetical protein BAOM_4797 [Peribacillus asahii]